MQQLDQPLVGFQIQHNIRNQVPPVQSPQVFKTVNKIEIMNDLKLDGMILDAAYDYFGTKVAFASADGKIIIIHIPRQGSHKITLSAHSTSPVWQVAWSHPRFSNLLASCSLEKCFKIWKEDNNEYKPIYTVKNLSGSVNTISWAKQEFFIAIGLSDGLVSVYVESQDKTQLIGISLSKHEKSVNCVEWLNNTNFASCGSDSKILIWEFSQNELKIIQQFDIQTYLNCRCARGVAWAPEIIDDEYLLAISGENGWLVLFLNSQFKEINKYIRTSKAPCWKVTWSPLGNQLAVPSVTENGQPNVMVFKMTDKNDFVVEI